LRGRKKDKRGGGDDFLRKRGTKGGENFGEKERRVDKQGGQKKRGNEAETGGDFRVQS
jgi:hypothetical protein